jgi:hypothetical protein
MQRYQKALKAVEKKYKAQLQAKDKEIQIYRQQNAHMRNIAELLAQRPINVEATAISESKAMQGDDNSPDIHVGGNATGNVFQTGYGSTDKILVATTLETGLNYAQKLQGFAEAIDKLRPHVQNAASWLEERDHELLPLMGLALL